jgi:AraC-like DNA-binding protein
MPGKREVVRHTFQTWVVGLVLRGAGTVQIDHGPAHAVAAPCGIAQWPGPAMVYGPTESWDELYVEFDPADGPRLPPGIFDPARPVRFLSDGAVARRLAQDLLDLAVADRLTACIDRVDRLADQLLVELAGTSAETPTSTRPAQTAVEVVAAIRAAIDANPLACPPPAEQAAAAGLSPDRFLRAWSAAVSVPPNRYRQQALLRLACRALAEGDEPINALARRLGFDDPLYFARRFRAFTGCTASEYRLRWQAR